MNENVTFSKEGLQRYFNSAFNEGVEYERERSQKLKEFLQSLVDRSSWWFCYDMGYDSEWEPKVKEMMDMANLFKLKISKALEEYGAGK